MPCSAVCGVDRLQPSKHSSDPGIQAFEVVLQDMMIMGCSKLFQAWPGLLEMKQATRYASCHKHIAHALMFLTTNHTLVSPSTTILCHLGLNSM